MRATVIAGKIGPAFSGAFISGHGSCDIPANLYGHRMHRAQMLSILFEDQAANVQEHIAERTDGYVPKMDITLGDAMAAQVFWNLRG